MTFRAAAVFSLIAVAAALALHLWLVQRDSSLAGAPGPDTHLQAALVAAVYDPYDSELLAGYGRLREAISNRDAGELLAVAHEDDSFRAYLAASTLAGWESVDPDTRYLALTRALELRIADPLARVETRSLQLQRAHLAEAAGRATDAYAAYLAALPLAEAVAAVERLQSDPYRLAAVFQSAGLHSRALQALAGNAAPSIEAPSLRALGRHAEAVEAFDRWLAEVPGSSAAVTGRAWSLFSLGRDDEARAAFTSMGEAGYHGLALLANRNGDSDTAVDLLTRTSRADLLWLATGILEARDRYSDALPLYLRLARGSSVYADDAAYRAVVLGRRLGRAEVVAEATELLPPGNFFALLLGRGPAVPDPASAPVDAGVELSQEVAAALDLATALYIVNEHEAAVGELLLALLGAEERGSEAADVLALIEMLQSMDEYRQSSRAARALLAAGENDLRAWYGAYPAAWPREVLSAATVEGIESALVWAVMRQESAFYPQAISVANAQGLMQVIPSTWDWIAELMREQPRHPFDVAANIAYGSHYLAWLTRYFDGDLELVIASYNGGQGYVRRLFEADHVSQVKDEFYREIDRSETREYLQRVAENLEVYRALYGADGGALADLP